MLYVSEVVEEVVVFFSFFPFSQSGDGDRNNGEDLKAGIEHKATHPRRSRSQQW